MPYSDLDDPQSLNQYGYARNNPLSRADADGHEDLKPQDWGQTGKIVDPGTPTDRKIGGAIVGGTLTLASFATGVGEIETAGTGAFFALKTFVKVLGVTGTAVTGVSTAVGTVTDTDVTKGNDMVTNVTNPVAGTAALVTSASNGSIASDLATIAKAAVGATGKGVSNPSELALSVNDQRSTISKAASTAISAIKGLFVSQPAPPAPLKASSHY